MSKNKFFLSTSVLENLLKGSITVLVSILTIYGIVQAGSLTPTANPAATSYTLTNIYTRLTTNATSTAGNHVFAPAAAPAGTLYTLTQIYDAIPTINAASVLSGTTYLGVAGTAYGDSDAAKVLTTATAAGTYNVSNLANSVIKSGTTWGNGLGSTGTLTPDGGTAAVGDLFNGKTVNLTNDWNLDTGTLNLACNTSTFDGASNLVANGYDGDGSGANRWCTTDSGTAVAGDMLSGKIAWVDGIAVTGTIATRTLGTTSETVSAGYYAATTLSTVDSDLAVGNIKSGITVFGLAGTLTPDGGTAAVGDLFNGKTVNLTNDWNLDTGTLNLACNTSTFDGASNLVANGYDGDGSGANRWCTTDSGTAVAGDMLSGKIAWVDGIAVTGTIATRTLGTTSETVSAGYYAATTLSTVDSDLAVGNIKSGVTLFGFAGDYPSATYPLQNASGTTDLAASGDNISSSNGAVEWWQSNGTRQTATLDFPTLSNVCSTDTSNNSAGTLSVSATAIGTGTTYCGTAGTLLGNLWNGANTAGTFPGGSQANGGVEDLNNAGAAAAGRYAQSWTACTSGADNYCGVGTGSADAKDNSTGLVWSKRCGGNGCNTFSDDLWQAYRWDSGGIANAGSTASQLCASGAHGETGWALPTQKQLMQAYIDGSYANLDNQGNDGGINWSATTDSITTTNAVGISLSRGEAYFNPKTGASAYVRCVR